MDRIFTGWRMSNYAAWICFAILFNPVHPVQVLPHLELRGVAFDGDWSIECVVANQYGVDASIAWSDRIQDQAGTSGSFDRRTISEPTIL